MRANARKRVLEHAFFNTRLRKSCACVLRVRWLLISDLYCTFLRYWAKKHWQEVTCCLGVITGSWYLLSFFFQIFWQAPLFFVYGSSRTGKIPLLILLKNKLRVHFIWFRINYLRPSGPWCIKETINNCIATFVNGGWVPGTSRRFHYHPPPPPPPQKKKKKAPRWRLLPWLANHGNRAMSLHTEGETGICHTELTVERRREGREDVWKGTPKQYNFHCKRYHSEGCQHMSQSRNTEC